MINLFELNRKLSHKSISVAKGPSSGPVRLDYHHTENGGDQTEGARQDTVLPKLAMVCIGVRSAVIGTLQIAHRKYAPNDFQIVNGVQH